MFTPKHLKPLPIIVMIVNYCELLPPKIIGTQECIPVGCVPSAAVAVPGGSPPGTPRGSTSQEEAPPLEETPPREEAPPLEETPPREKAPPRRKHPPGGSTPGRKHPRREETFPCEQNDRQV